ncbi:MAG: ATP-binding protein [Bacteroidota bacterium]
MIGSIYLKRQLETEVIELSQQFPAVVIIGPRQVGKTSLTLAIRNQVEELSHYLDLERPEDLAAVRNLEEYAEANLDSLIILDEIQRKPELFPELRSVIDRHRRPGRFLLLGSASLDLIRDASESLAGRIAIVELSGLLYPEVREVNDVKTHWVSGGFPESLLASDDRSSMRWRRFFLQTYFERDLLLLRAEVSPVIMRRLFTMVAHANGQVVNYSALSRSLGLDARTLKRYLDYLEQTFLIRRLPPYFANVGKRLVKNPKVLVRDSGVLHALLLIDDHNALLSHPAVGGSWESYVIEQIISSLPEGYEAFFYRTHNGAEIDLVITLAGLPFRAVEVKRAINPKLSRGFYTAQADLGDIPAFVVAPIVGAPLVLKEGVTLLGVQDLSLIWSAK